MIGYPGCKDQHQVELEKASKAGLLSLIERFFFVFGISREERLRLARWAKKEGRSIDSLMALIRYQQDPEREIERSLQRRLSGAKAARRRKKAKKGSAK